jgi:hypothetical protein
MMTTDFRLVLLVLGVSCACQLRPDLLEAGSADESDTSGDGDTSGDDDTTGDGGETTSVTGEPEPEPDDLECVLQGTNIDGGTDPEDFLLPEPSDCEVICAQGWGHDVPLLESHWTNTPPHLFDKVPTRGSLAILPDYRVAMVLSAPGEQSQMHWFAGGGSSWEGQGESVIHGEVFDFGISDDEIYYYLWDDGLANHLTATSEDAQEIFSLETGGAYTLEVIDDGVIVMTSESEQRIMRINQAGEIVFEQPIPDMWAMDVSPSGNVIALANFQTISWADGQGNFLGAQAIDDSNIWMNGLVAIDDANAVFVGEELEPGFIFEPGFEPGDVRRRGLLSKYGAMGPGWSHSYDRADAWCAGLDAQPTEERFTGIARLDDGTLLVTGIESLGHPYGNDIDSTSQPWVAHVSAAGEVLALDRGFWQGRAVGVVTRGNHSFVLLTDSNDATFGQPYVRKYSF